MFLTVTGAARRAWKTVFPKLLLLYTAGWRMRIYRVPAAAKIPTNAVGRFSSSLIFTKRGAGARAVNLLPPKRRQRRSRRARLPRSAWGNP